MCRMLDFVVISLLSDSGLNDILRCAVLATNKFIPGFPVGYAPREILGFQGELGPCIGRTFWNIGLLVDFVEVILVCVYLG